MIKIIYALSSFFGFFLPDQYVEVVTKKSFEENLDGLPPGESLWIVAMLSDSFEDRMLQINDVELLKTSDCREIIFAKGCRIAHFEVQREVQMISSDWLEKKLAPEIGIPEEKRGEFAQKFLENSSPFGLCRKAIIQVTH